MATANLLQTSVSGGTQNALSLQGDGVFFPKASTTSRLALTLTTTDKGFIVYDTTDNNIYFWNGTAWESIPGSGDAGANGSVQYNDAGTVSGASNFTYNKATSAVSIAGDLTVDTSTLKVDSTNNRVGIGTASPDKRCEINQSANAIITIGSGEILRLIGDDGNTNSRITEVGFGSGPTGATFAPVIVGAVNTSVAAYGTKDFYVATRATTADVAPLERLRVTSAGNVNVTTGNVVMTTSGKGIDFSAVTGGTGTATGNVLNDYEEGTWTIGLTFGGGTTGLTTSSNAGRYTKVGRQVTVSGYLALSNKGSSVGAAVINGLPFTIGAPNAAYSAASLRLASISYTGAFQAFGAVNGTTIGLEQISTLGAVLSLTDVNFANNSEIIFTITYSV